jgi:outer membrane protein OmpA-like peptidoglycan-associated protein
MNIRYFALALCVAIAGNTFAQSKKTSGKSDKAKETETTEVSDNLVANPSFEDCNIKTLKAYGQLNELCSPWFSPNKTSADLFAEGVKGTKVVAGTNDYGKQSPMDGTCYGGFRAYTKDPKKSRTYLETKLTTRLEKNQLYCVRINVSLADLSKFAVNNIGVFFSDRKIQNQNDFALTFTPQVTEKSNKVINNLDGWETICATFIATGNEEYIVIGGFGEDGKMKVEKVKKPAGVTGTVLNDAYYFIDNIEIVPVDAASQCICGRADKMEADLIYSRSSAKSPGMTPQQMIQASGIYFAALSAEIPAMFETDITEIARIMKENASIKLELIGHSDADETPEAKVNPNYAEMAKKRAEAVKTALINAGVPADRITVTSKDDTSPANTKATPMAKAQNRRVELIAR